MPDGQVTRAGSRSDRRIPKLRTRGRANREKLLAKAQRLLAEQGTQPIRFSDIFEAAGVSRGSAYRIYNSVEDLMQDLSNHWTSNFVTYVRQAEPITQPESWLQLSDYLLARAAAYWVETADILRVLPRVRSNVPHSYRAAINDLTKAVADSFDRYFFMPEIPEWQSTLAMYISLGDTIFADAIRREGRISNQRLDEAQRICNTYLSFYLPSRLRGRTGNT